PRLFASGSEMPVATSARTPSSANTTTALQPTANATLKPKKSAPPGLALENARPPLKLSALSELPSSELTMSSAGGEPLHPEVKTPIESSFGVNLGPVKVHSDASAQNAAKGFAARAFAFGRGIFLGRGTSTTDLGLMAHETAHVIQQQGTATVQRS